MNWVNVSLLNLEIDAVSIRTWLVWYVHTFIHRASQPERLVYSFISVSQKSVSHSFIHPSIHLTHSTHSLILTSILFVFYYTRKYLFLFRFFKDFIVSFFFFFVKQSCLKFLTVNLLTFLKPVALSVNNDHLFLF